MIKIEMPVIKPKTVHCLVSDLSHGVWKSSGVIPVYALIFHGVTWGFNDAGQLVLNPKWLGNWEKLPEGTQITVELKLIIKDGEIEYVIS